MRPCKALIATLPLALTFTLVSAAQAQGGRHLLEKYEPLLVFHPGEEMRPMPVDPFVADSNLEAATSPTTWAVTNPAPTVQTLPKSSPPVWRLNQRSCFAGAPLGGLACYAAAASAHSRRTIYGRIFREGDRTVLQYWLFYYDNVYRYPFLPTGAIWQSHEGDWEVVNVVLARGKPTSVGYSQHCSGETRSWAETARSKRHPIVFVALGSHANYFESGVHPFDRRCLPDQVLGFFQQAGLPLPADVAASGPTAGPRRSDEPIAVERLDDRRPAWLDYPGFWGELEYFNAPPPIGTVPFGTAPVGPAFHAVWQAPLDTLAGWN